MCSREALFGLRSAGPFPASWWSRRLAEWVALEIDVEAWVLDDTGFRRTARDSPGVKRQYSGTLGKTGTLLTQPYRRKPWVS